MCHRSAVYPVHLRVSDRCTACTLHPCSVVQVAFHSPLTSVALFSCSKSCFFCTIILLLVTGIILTDSLLHIILPVFERGSMHVTPNYMLSKSESNGLPLLKEPNRYVFYNRCSHLFSQYFVPVSSRATRGSSEQPLVVPFWPGPHGRASIQFYGAVTWNALPAALRGERDHSQFCAIIKCLP